MALTVNSNLASLNAQRNLVTSQGSLTTALQRLSSGLRINSAKDDAAGFAIADRFTAQIRGNDQAARNANDGISLAQTASGDLNQITSNLQRIRELAVQSANASNSDSDRVSLNNEANQLIQEIDRVAKNSSFNGTKLLDGSFTEKTFQIGANSSVNDRVSISSIASIQTANIGGVGQTYASTVTSGKTAGALTAGALTLNGQSVGASEVGTAPGQSTASATSIAAAINKVGAASGVTATANSNSVTGGSATAFTQIAAGAFNINGIDIGTVAAGGTAAGQGANLATAINLKAAQTGVTASADASTGALTLTAADGRDINIGLAQTAAGSTAATAAKTTFLSQTGLSTGVVGVSGANTVVGTAIAVAASNALVPASGSGATIAAGTLVVNGNSTGEITSTTASNVAAVAAVAGGTNATFTISGLTAGSVYTMTTAGTAGAGAFSFTATGNDAADATSFMNAANAQLAGSYSQGTNLGSPTNVLTTLAPANAQTVTLTAVRTAADITANVTVAQATISKDAAATAANLTHFTFSAGGTLGQSQSGGAEYNAQQLSGAINRALTAAGSASSVTQTATGFTVAGAAVTFNIGGRAADAATAAATKATLVTSTGLTVAQLGEQAFSSVNSGANHGTVTLTSSNASGIVLAGANAALAGLSNGTTTATLASSVSSIANVSLLTAAGATKALDAIDGALTTVSTVQGALGAYQNRFESTVASLQTTTENLTASRSRIQDADFAKETAALSRAQVLQQAGTAILAQANQSSQGVLSLLR